MEYTGQYKKYPINRPLTEQEISDRLDIKQPQPVELMTDDFKVIRLNSTFMEIVDKFWEDKGFISCICLIGIGLFSGGSIAITWISATGEAPFMSELPWLVLVIAGLFAPTIFFLSWLLKKESFRYTHYPIRFNRKERLVHMFRQDGSVLTASWDKAYWCIGKAGRYWEIQGHVMSEDGQLVLETIPLPKYGLGEGDKEELIRLWEFVRQYMENPTAAKSYNSMTECMPIANKKPSMLYMLKYSVRAVSFLGPIFMAIKGLMWIAYSPGKWFAFATSKIPKWPEEIEAQCRIEPDDRYVKEAQS